MKNILLCGLAVLGIYQATAQNNPIFFGGIGDGHTNASYAQAFVNHSFGGVGDGHSMQTGGMPAADEIFYGGIGDGFTSQTSGVPDVDRIFFGGAGDGWSNISLPLSPLPLGLLSFTGIQKNGAHYLSWITASENRADYYILQRSSNSGNFSDLGKVASGNDNGNSNEYEYIDEHPLQGNNFYRLVMVDKEGRSKHSNTVLLKMLRDKSVLSIYPNPVAAELHIELSGKADDSEVLIDIYDAAARLIKHKTIRKDNNTFLIDVGGLASGVYTIRIINREDISSVKFVKQ